MTSGKALLELRWSRPKSVTEICGTSEGLKRLADAASRAAADGKAEVVDDTGIFVSVLRDEDLRAPPKKKPKAAFVILGTTLVVYAIACVLAIVGACTVWKWFFTL